MDLRRLDELYEAWDEYPPVHVVAARYVGWNEKKNQAASDDEFEVMMASLPKLEQ